MALEVVERRINRRLVRVAYVRSRVRITEGGEQRHGLRGLERQVEPRDLPAPEPTQRLGRPGIEPTPDGVQVIGFDFAIEAEARSSGPGPPAGRLADASVVLVDAVGDGLDVVVLAVQSDLSDAEHEGTFRWGVSAVS